MVCYAIAAMSVSYNDTMAFNEVVQWVNDRETTSEAIMKLKNPYLESFELVRGDNSPIFYDRIGFSARKHIIHESLGACVPLRNRVEYCKYFAWAVPNEEALHAIAKLAPICELGGGNGYWAWMLQQIGCDISSYDIAPIRNKCDQANEWHDLPCQPAWSVVEKCSNEMIPTETLMLCWPPYDQPMAAECLKRYKGNNLIYIGENTGGCTANDEFFELLNDWHLVDGVTIPQWAGMHDYVQFYVRGVA